MKMRWFWLSTVVAFTVCMGMSTPYAFRHEPAWQLVVWCAILSAFVAFIARALCFELWLRKANRRAGSDSSEP
jgi:hypothetical protein